MVNFPAWWDSHQLRIGVFPGQFDPITNGHLDVIHRGLTLFDELIVAVGINPEKREMFSIEERVEMIGLILKDTPRVRVERYAGLTVDFVRKVKAHGDPPRNPRRHRPAIRVSTGDGQPRRRRR